MKSFLSWSIRAYLMLIVAVAVTPALLMVAVLGVQLRHEAIHDAEMEALRIAQSLCAQQEYAADSARQLLTTLAELPAVRHRDEAACNTLLAALLKQNAWYANLLVAEPDGMIFALGTGEPRFSIADRKFFRDAMATRAFSSGEYVISRSTNKKVFHFAYPVLDDAGDPLAVLIAAFDLDYFGYLMVGGRLSSDFTLTLTDHKGIVLFRHPATPGIEGHTDMPEMMAAMSAPLDSDTFVATETDGVRRFYGYSKARMAPGAPVYMYMRCGIPVKTALAPASRAAIQSMAWLSGAALLTLALAWFISSASILRRLRKLIAASDRLGTGDMTARSLLPHGRGDFGRLAAAFDAMAQTLEIRERERDAAERDLRESERRLAEAQRLAKLGNWEYDVSDERLFWSSEAQELLGPACGESTLEGFVQHLHADDVAPFLSAIGTAIAGGLLETECRLRAADGSEQNLYIKGIPNQENGRTTRILGAIQDVTERYNAEKERRKLEAQVQHAQKLESLGILAGGVAHDFNNLLAGILGNADLALLDLPPDSPARRSVHHVLAAAHRAADLTKQMLAYTGKSAFAVQPVNISALVQETGELLAASISKKCALRYELEDAPPAFEGDPTQIRQVIMNLIINASEAIGDRAGSITLRTYHGFYDRLQLDRSRVSGEARPGEYVGLEVADTGCGMSADVLDRVFDPFFSTKFTGRGLGMAAVHGIIRAHRGVILVDSREGEGTTVQALFPSLARPAPDAPSEKTQSFSSLRGEGTILVVDDEASVRLLAATILERAGFSVVAASDGREACKLFELRSGAFRAILLDMTMPIMSGMETLEALRRIDPNVKVILSSGFNVREIDLGSAGQSPNAFLQKPYRSAELLAAVHAAIAS